MKLPIILRSTYEAELERATNIITEKNRVIAVKKDEIKAQIKIKETLRKRIEELQHKNSMLCEDVDFLQNKINKLEEEKNTFKFDLEGLEIKIQELDEANKKLIDLFNDANRKNWCNNESARQLKQLAEDILESDKINKAYLASYIFDISKYVGGGIPAKLEVVNNIEE